MPPDGDRQSQEHGHVPLVAVWRGDTIESVHHGVIVATDPGGRVVAAAGDPETVTFLRSAAKPFQVIALIESGAADRFGFTNRQIAVMAGSHAGEAVHLAEVRSILDRIDMDESALQCGAHAPFHRPTARELRRRGDEPSVLHNNCSGKHAGMLAFARHIGAPAGDYLDLDHPVQRRIREVIELFAGVPAGAARPATDGCSAPTFALPLRQQARMFARMLDPGSAPPDLGGAARRIVEAMRAHPDMVAGSDQPCTALMQATRETFIAKIGAEGVYGLGWATAAGGDRAGSPRAPGQRTGAGPCGLAVKIADGDGSRARISATLEALDQLEVLPAAAIASLRGRFVEELHNHRGLRVGHVATVFKLQPCGAVVRATS